MVNIASSGRNSGLIPRVCSFALTALFLALAAQPAAARYASIVIDTKTGKVLHATNADTPNYPASLTKMMTLYMIFEGLDNGKLTLTQRLRVRVSLPLSS